MKSGKTISIGKILWDVLQKPIVKELSIEIASEKAVECIRLLGAPSAYDKLVEKIKITDYKGALPANLLHINGVRYRDCENCDFESALALREATNVFHTGTECNDCNDGKPAGELTYIVQNNVIITSVQDGWAEIAFDGIVTDKEGFPMIPDEQPVINAIRYYIIWSYLEDIMHTGKLPQYSFNYYEQKKLFYMASAANSLQMPSVDKMESMSNALNRILIRTNWHDNFFKYFGEKERFNRHY